MLNDICWSLKLQARLRKCEVIRSSQMFLKHANKIARSHTFTEYKTRYNEKYKIIDLKRHSFLRT